MKLAIVGAGGNLGSRIAGEAVTRGHAVTAIIRSTPCPVPGTARLQKDLFDLTPEDAAELDALYSAYGSGFQADPEINRRAINHLAGLVKGTKTHLILIGGAGCLYCDGSEIMCTYETPEHPPFLKGISANLALGLSDLEGMDGVDWTFVCPSLALDLEGPRTGDYLTRSDRHILRNEDGASYVSYADLAAAMVDFGEQGAFKRQLVTVASRKGQPGTKS